MVPHSPVHSHGHGTQAKEIPFLRPDLATVEKRGSPSFWLGERC